MESEAVCAEIAMCLAGVHRWVSSDALQEELLSDPDNDRGGAMAAMLRFADERLTVDARSARMAEDFTAGGIGAMDAVHLALAEQGQCDVLLTTDDQFFRKAAALSSVHVKVENPTQWVAGELRHGT